MKLIQTLCEKIEEEINDAKSYAELALDYKGDRVAETFVNLSQEELRHMSMLHSEVERIISEYRKQNGEPPAPMLAVYEYLHRKHIAAAAEARRLQEMYRE